MKDDEFFEGFDNFPTRLDTRDNLDSLGDDEKIARAADVTVFDYPDYAWLELSEKEIVKPLLNINNPMLNQSSEELANPGLRLMKIMSDPNHLAVSAKILCNIDLLPIQSVVMKELWEKTYPMLIAVRGFGKTFLLGLYSVLRAVLVPRSKIIVVGSAFRQSKLIFEYAEAIWNDSPVLRSICDSKSHITHNMDKHVLYLNDSQIIAVPIGTGEKIRGMRATDIISDEFDALNEDIFERVIAGFISVAADPLSQVQAIAKKRAMGSVVTSDDIRSNKIILSGTAGYSFNHFYRYFQKYRKIIEFAGDVKKLREFYSKDEISEGLDADDYSILRVDHTMMPEGFMDAKAIARAKATVHTGTFGMEYGAVFAKDSEGFFKRSLVESCVANKKNIEKEWWPSWCSSPFSARTHGDSSRQYIFGIDPASEHDNFSIVVLELHENHTRIVYVWTTNRKDFQNKIRHGVISEHDFYGYCCRKIRDLMRTFPCVRIMLDSQGGGVAIEEGLHDPDKIQSGEQPIWPVIEEGKSKAKDSDDKAGLHIIELCVFVRADWVSQANHGLRKDMEDKALLFPEFDSVVLGLAAETAEIQRKKFEDNNPGKTFTLYDSIEDCMIDIEELKDELSSIVITRTGSGIGSRDHWDTPETKTPDGKKGRLRKDRYSSLMMANMGARSMHRMAPPPQYQFIGGTVGSFSYTENPDNQLYKGPEWYSSAFTSDVCQIVKK